MNIGGNASSEGNTVGGDPLAPIDIGSSALDASALAGTPLGASAPVPAHLGICDFGFEAIEQARNPAISVVEMSHIRGRLSCPGCLSAFDLEVKLKTTLAATAFEAPPAALQQRITNALGSIDLSNLDITDF